MALLSFTRLWAAHIRSHSLAPSGTLGGEIVGSDGLASPRFGQQTRGTLTVMCFGRRFCWAVGHRKVCGVSLGGNAVDMAYNSDKTEKELT